MSALNLFAQRAGTIRRVIRRGGVFVCGMCRSAYGGEDDAQDCVRGCWEELLTFNPVIPRGRGKSRTYRCRFCARDYPNVAQASGCASACLETNLELYQLEQSLVVLVDMGHVARPTLKLQAQTPPPQMLRLPPKPKAKPKKEAAPTPPAAAPPPPVVEAAPPAPAEKKPKPKKAFYRDEAYYVCNICKKQYFTRLEVQACFDKHDSG